MNSLLATLETDFRWSYERGPLLRLDKRFGELEHRLDNWSISVARGIAWCDAELLWGVRNHAGPRDHYGRSLDHAVALAGECPLFPAGLVRQSHEAQPCCVQAAALPGPAGPPAG